MWKCHTVAKQLPLPDEDSLIFWEGCRRGRLLIQQCRQCDTFRFPPSPVCARCHSSWVTWQEDPGQGEVATFCIYYSEIAGPAWKKDLPYTVAVIRLWHSGVYLLSNLHCKNAQAVRVGLPVQVYFAVMNEHITLPQFVPLQTSPHCPPTQAGDPPGLLRQT
jgi:uncharacterized protein